MRDIRACAALAALLLGARVAVAEGEVGGYQLPEGEIEVGGFYNKLSHDQPDWTGQRTLVRLRPWQSTQGQLELLQAWRGGDSAQLGSLALWQGLGSHLWTFGSVTGSTGGHFLPTWRADAELHVVVPHFENLQPFFGGGYADYQDFDSGIWTVGASYYLPLRTLALLSYRFTHFQSDLEGHAWGSRSDSHLHTAQLIVGSEQRFWGQIDATYTYGTDLIQDFVSTGTDEHFRTHGVRLGWRRRWSRHLGTYLGADWAHKSGTSRGGITFDEFGGEARLIWYFGGPR